MFSEMGKAWEGSRFLGKKFQTVLMTLFSLLAGHQLDRQVLS